MKTPKVKSNGPSDAGIIIFGLSQDGKPQAGKFAVADIELVTKAAQTLGFNILKVDDPPTRRLATRLSSGKAHATGRELLRNIAPARFEHVLEVATAHGFEGNELKQPMPQSKAIPPQSPQSVELPKSFFALNVGASVLFKDSDPKEPYWESIVVKKEADRFTLKRRKKNGYVKQVSLKNLFQLGLMWPGKDIEPTGKNASVSNSKFPQSWGQISVNAVVLAQEKEGLVEWYESVILKIEGDALTLRWRDYPKEPEFTRSRYAVALICPIATAPKSTGRPKA